MLGPVKTNKKINNNLTPIAQEQPDVNVSDSASEDKQEQEEQEKQQKEQDQEQSQPTLGKQHKQYEEHADEPAEQNDNSEAQTCCENVFGENCNIKKFIIMQ